MFTAQINRKETSSGQIKIFVDFSDGTNTTTEWCIPQSDFDFKQWVKSRLEALNSSVTLDSAYTDGDTVDVTEPTPTQPTQAEIDRDAWLAKYHKWVAIKNNLIDTGVLTGTESQVVSFLNDVKTGFKPAYLDYL